MTLEQELKYDSQIDYAVENELICNEKYCPFHYYHMSSPSNPTCEGRYCEEAYQNYCEERDRETI